LYSSLREATSHTYTILSALPAVTCACTLHALCHALCSASLWTCAGVAALSALTLHASRPHMHKVAAHGCQYSLSQLAPHGACRA
jgi:hypothetical protein